MCARVTKRVRTRQRHLPRHLPRLLARHQLALYCHATPCHATPPVTPPATCHAYAYTPNHVSSAVPPNFACRLHFRPAVCVRQDYNRLTYVIKSLGDILDTLQPTQKYLIMKYCSGMYCTVLRLGHSAVLRCSVAGMCNSPQFSLPRGILGTARRWRSDCTPSTSPPPPTSPPQRPGLQSGKREALPAPGMPSKR